MLEETIFCNDRQLNQTNQCGWQRNGNFSCAVGFINASGGVINRLNCINETDQFSVSNSKAQINYPIGLATAPEMKLYNNKAIINISQEYWLMTPDGGYQLIITGYVVDTSGNITGAWKYLTGGRAVRPVVSIKYGVTYVSGDGSMANPYILLDIE